METKSHLEYTSTLLLLTNFGELSFTLPPTSLVPFPLCTAFLLIIAYCLRNLALDLHRIWLRNELR